MKTPPDSAIWAAIEILKVESIRPALKEQAHEYLALVLRKAHEEQATSKKGA